MSKPKTAIVYDKWLDTLGGGEFLTCKIAKILIDAGYDVTFVCGKIVETSILKTKLNIDLSKAKFVEIWNDEIKLKQLCRNKDLFINATFMDYSHGCAKKNIYITYFPTKTYTNIKGYIFNKFLLKIATSFVKPIEFLQKPDFIRYLDGRLLYTVNQSTKVAYFNLNSNKIYTVKFSGIFNEFTKSYIEKIKVKFENAKILKDTYKVVHVRNQIIFRYQIKPLSGTVYLKIINYNTTPKNNFEVILDKIKPVYGLENLLSPLTQRTSDRIRAGIFSNIKQRMLTYDHIIAISEFTKRGIKNYWGLDSEIIYPPVDMLFSKSNQIKKNYIINIGRFFTLGHGKKQEIMIEAFKKMYNDNKIPWQLHLVGGVGTEPTSIEFIKHLKEISQGYPIFFHFNIDRKDLVNLLKSSKIYWHATGYSENENKDPMKFEHFGIAPIEAISAGCYPILYRGGGLPDIIKTAKFNDNSLFSSIDELIEHTLNIINDPELVTKLEESTKKLLRDNYSDAAFEKQILKII